MLENKLNLLSSALAAILILGGCDSASFAPESEEIDVRLVFDSEGNVLNLLPVPESAAASCTATAYSIKSATSPDKFDDDFSPARAIDGKLGQSSRWSSKGQGRSITFDLGSTEIVDYIQTAWYKANIRTAFFDVDTSIDGTTWTSVLSGATAQGSEGFIGFDLQATNARFVKIIGQGNSLSAWNSLIEARIFGCHASTPPGPSAPAGDNLVSNGTFEDGLTGWEETEPVFQSGQVYEGSGSAKIEDEGSISQVLAVKSNTSYRVSAQVEGEGVIGVVVAGSTTVARGTGRDYDRVAFDFNSGGNSEVRIFANAVSGTVRIDNFEVVEAGDAVEPPQTPPPQTPTPQIPPPQTPAPTPPAPGGTGNDVNVVFNGTFENNLSGWAQIEPAQSSSEAYEGNGSAKIFSLGSISQKVFLQPNSRYRMSTMIEGTPTIGIRVGGNTIDVRGSGSNDYVPVSFEFNTGNADNGEIFARASSSSESARVDNVELFKISDNPIVGPAPVDPNTVFDFSIWEVEGETPITRTGLLSYKALEQCVITPNGNGCRHEQKVLQSERYGLTEQYERFSADIEANLSRGSETIVVQHHPEETGTLSALYISDNALSVVYPEVKNGIANDGVFDVYVTIRKPDGTRDNEVVILGTVTSGEIFHYEVINDHGTLTMSALGERATVTSADSSSSYLKFGNYQQARDPVSRDRLSLPKPHSAEARDKFLDYYASYGMTESEIVFRNVFYQRIID